jgi:hypothetical protein
MRAVKSTTPDSSRKVILGRLYFYQALEVAFVHDCRKFVQREGLGGTRQLSADME